MGKVIVIRGEWDRSPAESVADLLRDVTNHLPFVEGVFVEDEAVKTLVHHAENLGEGHSIVVNVTDEGVVLDTFSDGEPNGTHAMMFGELYDWVQSTEAKRWGR